MPKLILAVLALACMPSLHAEDNPYVLKLDRSAYVLRTPQAPILGSAAAGASAAASRAPQTLAPPSAADTQRITELQELQRRQLEYEHRINELVRNRDAWMLHAQRLESELMLGRTTRPLHLPPLPTVR